LQTSAPLLITGAAGWLGHMLVAAARHGIAGTDTLASPIALGRVRCLVRPGERTDSLRALAPEAEIVEGDVTSASDCARFCQGAAGGILLHTAGVIHPRRVREFYAVNVRGTVNMLDAAASAGVARAVVVSSNSPCGCNPHPDHLFDEQSPYNPYMNYGRSKMQMEQAVKQRHAPGRFETVIIRAPWFYGPFQPGRQTLFFRMVRDGKAPVVGSGKNRRSMAHTANLAQGLYLAALTPRAAGELYWIADARPYPMLEIMDTIERLLETEFGQVCAHRRQRLPGVASEVAYAADKLIQAAGLYHPKIHVLSEMNKTIACSIAKARRDLGYAPTMELESGMRDSLRHLIATGERL
jgi:nucleoside-diphosphate-sugar epimerase